MIDTEYHDTRFDAEQEKDEGNQWGKPGPGGAYWRESALTGAWCRAQQLRSVHLSIHVRPGLLREDGLERLGRPQEAPV